MNLGTSGPRVRAAAGFAGGDQDARRLYGAFSAACFALLGLWLVVVQIRLPEWQPSAADRRMSYGVALHFALPGIMSVLALVNPADPAFWRVSFAIIALGGAVVMVALGGASRAAARPGRRRPRPGAGRPGPWPGARPTRSR